MYDSKGKLTREGAEQVIRNGGSVLHNGNVYNQIETLPAPAQFVRGDREGIQQERERLRAQREALDTQLNDLSDAEKQLDLTDQQQAQQAQQQGGNLLQQGALQGTGQTDPNAISQQQGGVATANQSTRLDGSDQRDASAAADQADGSQQKNAADETAVSKPIGKRK